MKFYNIIMIHTMHISKKLIWSCTENRSETCYFTTGLFRMILHVFCAASNQFFWYVHCVYHYYIIEFHYLGLDRHFKIFFDVDAHIKHTFCDNFWNLKKNSKSCCKTACFWAIFQFFQYELKIIFFGIYILCIIIILCRYVLKFIRDSQNFFSSIYTQLAHFPSL